MSDAVLFEQEGHVVTLTLNRPESRNPVSEPEVIDALVRAVERINADVTVRAVIITGAGSAFSSGGNVKHMHDRSGMFAGAPHEIRERYRRGIQRIPLSLYHIKVPTIAAVNGPAIGAGCDLVCMCDMRIASKRAWFAESFVKLGIIPGDGGAWLLPRAIGMARACEMAFTGDRISAETAMRWGLVSQVVAPEQLANAAEELAARVACNPPQALRMTKTLIREGQHMRLDSLLEMSASMQAIAHHSRDHAEAVSATLQKRAGHFTGE